MYLAFMSMFNFLNDVHVACLQHLNWCPVFVIVMYSPCIEQLDEFLVTGFDNYLPFDITYHNCLK